MNMHSYKHANHFIHTWLIRISMLRADPRPMKNVTKPITMVAGMRLTTVNKVTK